MEATAMVTKTLNALVQHTDVNGRIFTRNAPALTLTTTNPIKIAAVSSVGFYSTEGAAITQIEEETTALMKFTVSSADAGASVSIFVGEWVNWPPSNGYYFFTNQISYNVLPNASISTIWHTDVQGFTAEEYIITFNQAITTPTEFTIGFYLDHSGNANSTSETAYIDITNNGNLLQVKYIRVTGIGL